MFGLLLYAFGIMMTIKANIGYGPWDVLHVGLSRTTGISLGVTSIWVGVIVVILCILLKETLGLGTILNMILIGVYMDLIIVLGIIPTAQSFLIGVIMFVAGLFVIALATYYYLSSGFGAGPRDSLMVGMSRKLGWSVGVCRTILEFSATVLGYFFGGTVGAGTVICVLIVGFAVQTVFNLFKFDATAVHHESLKETMAGVFGK
ncbi:MAG: hypothetical protein GXZ11_06980 [Tissierellia bacterium]|nr:hypothetical protein [Tissierellia bacterium]